MLSLQLFPVSLKSRLLIRLFISSTLTVTIIIVSIFSTKKRMSSCNPTARKKKAIKNTLNGINDFSSFVPANYYSRGKSTESMRQAKPGANPCHSETYTKTNKNLQIMVADNFSSHWNPEKFLCSGS